MSDKPWEAGRFGNTERGRPWTCFSCGKEGHRSFDCPNKKIGNPVVGRMAPVSRVQ